MSREAFGKDWPMGTSDVGGVVVSSSVLAQGTYLPSTRPVAASSPEERPHFALLGVPVHVRIGFFIVPLLLAAEGTSFSSLLMWVAVVFVSVMLHEMGHALVARAYGAHPSITLYALGGLTRYEARMSRAQTALISLAGPGAGFVLGFAVLLLTQPLHLAGAGKEFAFNLMYVNIGWGVMNLLPVLPFDGGQLLAAAMGPKRSLATAIVSASVGILVAVAGMAILKNVFIAILFGSAAVSAIMEARTVLVARADTRDGFDRMLADAKAALQAGDGKSAADLANEVAGRARVARLRNEAWTTLAWVHIVVGEGNLARQALMNVKPQGDIDLYTLAAVEDAAGEPEHAKDILLQARQLGLRTAEMTKLLVDLFARGADLAAAAEIAREDAALLGRDQARAVLIATRETGAHVPAAALAGQLFVLFGTIEDGIDQSRELALAGNTGEALDTLERVAASAKDNGEQIDPATFGGDPCFESLRSEPRFTALIERFGAATSA
jgi:Zn-dependent protease